MHFRRCQRALLNFPQPCFSLSRRALSVTQLIAELLDGGLGLGFVRLTITSTDKR
jgi:hypothetical protein